MVFVTTDDETGEVQVIVWPNLLARRRRELGTQVVGVTGRVSRWAGTRNVTATDRTPSLQRFPTDFP